MSDGLISSSKAPPAATSTVWNKNQYRTLSSAEAPFHAALTVYAGSLEAVERERLQGNERREAGLPPVSSSNHSLRAFSLPIHFPLPQGSYGGESDNKIHYALCRVKDNALYMHMRPVNDHTCR